MPKNLQNNDMLPFPGGIDTESNLFSYPPECTVDEQNFLITKDGKRERRLGIVIAGDATDIAPAGCTFEDKVVKYVRGSRYKYHCSNTQCIHELEGYTDLIVDGEVTNTEPVYNDSTRDFYAYQNDLTVCPYCNQNTLSTPIEETSEEIEAEVYSDNSGLTSVDNVVNTATYTKLDKFILKEESGSYFQLNVYDQGAYAEMYRKPMNGSITLIGKYYKGDIISFPFSTLQWEVSDNSVKVNPFITMIKGSSFITNLKNLLNKMVYKSDIAYKTKAGPSFSASKICTLSAMTYHYGGRYSSSYYIHTIVGKNYTLDLKDYLQDLPVGGAYTINISDEYSLSKSYSDKKVTFKNSFGTVKSSDNPGYSHWISKSSWVKKVNKGFNVTYKTLTTSINYQYYKNKHWVTFIDAKGDSYKFTSLSYSSKDGTYTVSQNNLINSISNQNTESVPDWSSIVTEEMINTSVMQATYSQYRNKTRIQIGKMASESNISSIPRHYIWRNVDGVQGQEFIVFFTKTKIVVCRYNPPNFFSQILYATIGIGADDVCAVDGRLVIVNKSIGDITCLEYNSESENFNHKTYRLKIRDQWGLSEKGSTTSSISSKSYTVLASALTPYLGNIKRYKVNHGWNLSEAVFNNTVSIVCVNGNLTSPSVTSSPIGGDKLGVDYIDNNNCYIYYVPDPVATTHTFTLTYSKVTSSTSYDPLVRISTDTDTRRYNMYNRGWALPRKDEDGKKVCPYDYFKSKIGKYPANNESVYTAISLNPGYYHAEKKTWEKAWERLYPELWDDSRKAEETDISSAMGEAIIDLLDRGKGRWDWYTSQWRTFSSTGAIGSIPTDRTEGGPSCVADYAGRMFYAGFSNNNIGGDDCTPHLGSYVFFSQLVRNYEDLPKCYQEGDPTSRTENDIIDTDGGFVRISGAQGIVSMRQCAKGLIIFAQNGVWLLMGGSDYGFTAANHKVQKLSPHGAIHRDSICGDGEQWAYFSESGIMQIYPDQFGDLQVNNISYNKIHTNYKGYSYPTEGVVGSFDKVSGTYHWIVERNTVYTTELLFNIALSAFTQNVFYNDAENGRYVVSPICLDEEIETGVGSTSQYRNYQSTIYLCRSYLTQEISEDNYTIDKSYRIGYLGNTYYMDFGANDAVAYLQSGPFTGGDAGIYKQTPYINSYMVRTEKQGDEDNPLNKSSCKCSVAWDWTIDKDTHRWTRWWDNDGNEKDYFELYRHRQPLFLTKSRILPSYNNIVESRSKLRGRGKALSYILSTEVGKDCRLAGLNVTFTGNQFK